MSDHVEFQAYILNVVRGVGVACGPDYPAEVHECEFILKPVPKSGLIKRDVRQCEIQWDKEAITIYLSDGQVGRNEVVPISCADSDPCDVFVADRINTEVMIIFFSRVVFQRSW
ncbi:MAG: hypothetical protein AB2693_31685 [Candidatus Thiodiazotropha sp.]